MTESKNKPQKNKISSEFSARLDCLDSQQKVRAIVLLHTNAAGAPKWRQSRADRKAAISEIRKSAEEGLTEIDEILGHYDGKRLSGVNALGSTLIETTAAGIIALAASEHVRAILEDQPVSLLRQPKHA